MWHKVAKVSDVPEDTGQAVDLSGKSIALFNSKGKFYAMDNHCPHRGGPLADGYLEGKTVTCPWHAWQFDITNGACDTMEGAKQTCYATKIENDEVWVEL